MVCLGNSYRERGEVKLYVGYLRRQLRQAASIDPLETVRGIGYRCHPWLPDMGALAHRSFTLVRIHTGSYPNSDPPCRSKARPHNVRQPS
jgi:hypothetical protein